MTKVLVLYYSRYGQVARLATAIAEGARSVPDTEVVIKRVPDLTPDEATERHGSPSAALTASVEELGDYDAILFGTLASDGSVALSRWGGDEVSLLFAGLPGSWVLQVGRRGTRCADRFWSVDSSW